jgi:arabinan endo-1,5-alpha-L-arabinosidase
MRFLRKSRVDLFLATGLLFLVFAVRTMAMETDCVIHDPSTIIKNGATYWVFGTGHGIDVYSSQDLRHWTAQPSVFAAQPAWIAAAVPKHRDGDFWAPAIRRIGNRYCLYYAVSSFGRNISAIGLVTSPSLQSPHWTDRGMIVRSVHSDHFNAIDPSVIREAKGALWMSFGSFWSGIKLIELNRDTGEALPGPPQIYSLASHPQDRDHSIEASYLWEHHGYYYLFVNWGLCCRGEQSTYSIQVGRSRVITGPYEDKDGRDMHLGGGSLFLGTLAPNSPGYAEVGPGQSGILASPGGDWFSCHYEWAQDRQGLPILNVMNLGWGKDGWPVLSEH